jgi:CheY-like chemotaxis protein
MSSAAIAHPHLLVVEDDPEILSIVHSVFEDEGCFVTEAPSLAASLPLLSEHLFHLVITDLFGGPGLPALESIRPLIKEAAPIPVGILTAWEIAEPLAIQAGASFLLGKPFDLDDLVRVTRAELAKTPSYPQQTELVEQFFAALNEGNWLHLARLCTPDLIVLPLAAPVTLQSAGHGILAYRPLLERRFHALPGNTIEGVQVFMRSVGMAARYTARWQGRNGVLHWVAGSLHFSFRDNRIAQVVGAF